MVTQQAGRTLVVVGVGALVCGSGCAWLPGEVPPELLAVLAAPGTFDADEHPLADVEAGTQLDEAAALDGCWGSYQELSGIHGETGEPATVRVMQVLRIDLEAGTIEEYLLTDSTFAPSPFNSANMQLGVVTADLTLLGDNRFARTITVSESGELTPDGRIVLGIATLLSPGINEGVQYETLFTVDGDYLKTLDGGIDYPPEELSPEEAAGNTQLWRRLDCTNTR